ncbi:succinate semialdehyde dehydrogenase [Hysterangium stoloniferum]|nr:succinate semialdehyde dehydrogenase [Hysterangium stoloniferum]
MSQTTIIPHSQKPLVTRDYPSPTDLDAFIGIAKKSQTSWRNVPLSERIAIGRKFMAVFEAQIPEITLELSNQMGRPIKYNHLECKTMLARADYLLNIAEKSLEDVVIPDYDKTGNQRTIKRVPHGVVLVIAPWNFPFLVTINSIIPAIVAGNTVILKPSPQTPLTAERLAAAWSGAGLPENVFQVLHLSPELTEQAVKDSRVNYVVFTGSVKGGKAVDTVAVNAEGFKGVALELGGKDPAYVREDADLDFTVPELVDGSFFNSGQSCCAVERIYVHASKYDAFVQKFIEETKGYKLGDPTDPNTTLGPVVSLASAERIRKQISDAVASGAKILVPESLFSIAQPGTTYVAPQVLVEVNHSMDVMKEETFGPVVGIMKVSSDSEAIDLMNDSPYGLTASIWTSPQSQPIFNKLAAELETGTVFLNKCDAVDPSLAWTGVKYSGRGVSCSQFGYDQLTRPKSVFVKV